MTVTQQVDTGAERQSPGQRAALALIHGYQQAISPNLGTRCRFAPSCSHYAEEAIEAHGLGRGIWLSLRRLARCRPGGGSGFDPVPPRDSSGGDA